MNIVFTLSKLLFDHDQVVVSGLGVFTTEIEEVYVHPVEHSFSPEFKKIKFKADSKLRDDLLAKSIGGENADSLIADFVKKTIDSLKEGNKVQLKNIGFLYTHHTGEIILDQDLSFNYVKKNFGLESFIHEPVNKIIPAVEPVAAVAVQKERNKPKVWLYFLWLAAILIAIMALWKMDTIQSFFNEVPGKNIVESKPISNDLSKDVNKESGENELATGEGANDDTLSTDSTTSTNKEEAVSPEPKEEIAEQPIVEEVKEEPKEEPKAEVLQSSGPKYYVIAGCFRSEFKANRLLKDLKSDGFDKASIEGKTPNGLIRVCYATYPKRHAASNYMLKLQNEGRKGVWIQKEN